MTKYHAIKTECRQGHKHASKREARRCDELSLLERAGKIAGLQHQPVYTFIINGQPVRMLNGHSAKLTADFAYVEDGKKVVEDSKGMVTQDFRLRWAIARHLWPELDWRVS